MPPEVSNQILIELLRLKGEATSTDLFFAICTALKRDVATGTYSGALKTLIEKGCITRHEGEPRPIRGGRRQYSFKLTSKGRAVLIEMHRRATVLDDLAEQGLLGGI